MLGNDRANEFWGARLTLADELDCDATPEQRREFITQKYREGRFRHPHPSFSTQEELLKVTPRPTTTSTTTQLNTTRFPKLSDRVRPIMAVNCETVVFLTSHYGELKSPHAACVA